MNEILFIALLLVYVVFVAFAVGMLKAIKVTHLFIDRFVAPIALVILLITGAIIFTVGIWSTSGYLGKLLYPEIEERESVQLRIVIVGFAVAFPLMLCLPPRRRQRSSIDQNEDEVESEEKAPTES
ncbi:MAG: hypothetical protein AAF591_00510 [Verrucomicrobiota bacterium]